MNRIKEKLNSKSKSEQMFILVSMFVFIIGLVCLTGCGSQESCCEAPKCGFQSEDGFSIKGVSIPGCGGCLTSGFGCNTLIWPQSFKYVSLSTKDDDNSSDNNSVLSLNGCDIRYYGGGCLSCFGCFGCGYDESSCYSGFITYNDDNGNEINAMFYGSSKKDEKYCGFTNGSAGCVASDGIGFSTLYDIERELGVR